MQVVADLTFEALADCGTESLPGYEDALRGACDAHPPPFGMEWYGDKYRAAASDPGWLASSLVANAEKEGEGSRKLWALAGRVGAPFISESIRKHAVDEARHALMYIAMLENAFPEATDERLREELRALSPRFSSKDYPERAAIQVPEEHVLDELIQMNIGEIRTRIHQLLLRPMIFALAIPGGLEKVRRILGALLRDETVHVQYTARLIEAAARNGKGDLVRAMMRKRLAEFNEITLTEVGESRFVGE